VRQRGVDRRSHRRFEIVGTFLGSLETWHPLTVRNVGRGGALMETGNAFPRDWKLRTRLTMAGNSRQLRVDVRHATARSVDGRCLVGVEFPAPLDVAELPGEGQPAAGVGPAIERRRYSRVDPPDGFAIQSVHWTPVELADVSMSGVMFVAAMPVAVGRCGSFRARFGDQSFEAEVVSRRIVPRAEATARYGIGASFVSMSEESSRSLASFLVTAET
jgi:hypothetical protein